MKKALKVLLGVAAFFIIVSLFIGDSEDKKDDAQLEEKPAAVENIENEEMPEISEEAIEYAYDVILAYDDVKDAHVTVEEDDQAISLAIQVGAAMNEELAKELADSFVRALSTGVSIYGENAELDSPSGDDLGELYDYYNLLVVVGSSPEHTIVQGAKVKTAKNITW